MAAPPPALLPTNTSEFHAYAFSNACLRVYTIVSLRDKFKKDEASQMEASRGLHWEMAALFDHLSTCKMFGPVPIPTAVVPMLRHYTTLYETNQNPTVEIHAFPFEFNEFMTSRLDSIQGNRWWEPLLEGFVASEAPQTQILQQQTPSQIFAQHPPDRNMQSSASQSNQGFHAPLPPMMSTSSLDGAVPIDPPKKPPVPDPSTTAPTQTIQSADAPPAESVINTVANPAVPFFSVNAAVPADPNVQYATSTYAQRPGGSRFIPYNPPPTAGQAPSAQTSASAPVATRQAIIAPPVKNPRPRRRSIKTNEFIEEEGNAPNGTSSVSQGPSTNPNGQEQQAEKENGISGDGGALLDAQKKRPQDTLKTSDYIKPHEDVEACANCVTNGRKCLTSKDNRLKRCLECRMHQSKCVWPVSGTPTANGTAQIPPITASAAPAVPASPQAVDQQVDMNLSPGPTASTSASTSKSRPSNRFVAEVVVTPARRLKRKAPDAPSSAGSVSKRNMQLRSRGPVHEEEEDGEPFGSPLTSGPVSFEERAAAAQGGDAYMRSKIALLVDMARTAEMRLADVLGRVAELEAANRRMEKMIATLGGTPSTSGSPKRK